MDFKPFTDRIETAGVAVTGTNLFEHNFPSDMTRGILVRDNFAPTRIDPELPGYRKTSFQLIASGLTYDTVRQLMADAVAALTLEVEEVWASTPPMKVNYIRARHEPLFHAPSPGSRVEAVVNIDCAYVLL